MDWFLWSQLVLLSTNYVWSTRCYVASRSGGVTHSNDIVSIHSGVGGYLECQQHTVPSCVGAPVPCLAQEVPLQVLPKGGNLAWSPWQRSVIVWHNVLWTAAHPTHGSPVQMREAVPIGGLEAA